MKKILFVLLFLIGIASFAQNPMFVEYCISDEIENYDDIIAKCKENDAILVVNRYTENDTLSSSNRRINDLNCSVFPSLYLRGQLIDHTNLDLDWQDINESYGEYEDDYGLENMSFILEESSLAIYIYPISHNLNLFLTEDLIELKGINKCSTSIKAFGGILCWRVDISNCNIDSCKIIATIENENKIVVGVKEISVKDIATGIPQISIPKLEFYPNPATDFINFNNNIKSVEIFNMLGSIQFIENNFNNRIDVSNLKNDIYIIRAVTYDGKVLTSRFIKN